MSAPASEKMCKVVAEKVVELIRQEGRSLRRREMFFALPDYSESTLQAALKFAVEHGMLTRIGAGGAVRYVLPTNSGGDLGTTGV